LDQNERQLLLEKALKNLPEEEHVLIMLFYKSENSIEDISYITGLSVSNVKVRLHRIRKKLYEEMENMVTIS
jgi:RNA polymerase sigma factor (sigma-70 family)